MAAPPSGIQLTPSGNPSVWSPRLFFRFLRQFHTIDIESKGDPMAKMFAAWTEPKRLDWSLTVVDIIRKCRPWALTLPSTTNYEEVILIVAVRNGDRAQHLPLHIPVAPSTAAILDTAYIKQFCIGATTSSATVLRFWVDWENDSLWLGFGKAPRATADTILASIGVARPAFSESLSSVSLANRCRDADRLLRKDASLLGSGQITTAIAKHSLATWTGYEKFMTGITPASTELRVLSDIDSLGEASDSDDEEEDDDADGDDGDDSVADAAGAAAPAPLTARAAAARAPTKTKKAAKAPARRAPPPRQRRRPAPASALASASASASAAECAGDQTDSEDSDSDSGTDTDQSGSDSSSGADSETDPEAAEALRLGSAEWFKEPSTRVTEGAHTAALSHTPTAPFDGNTRAYLKVGFAAAPSWRNILPDSMGDWYSIELQGDGPDDDNMGFGLQARKEKPADHPAPKRADIVFCEELDDTNCASTTPSQHRSIPDHFQNMCVFSLTRARAKARMQLFHCATTTKKGKTVPGPLYYVNTLGPDTDTLTLQVAEEYNPQGLGGAL